MAIVKVERSRLKRASSFLGVEHSSSVCTVPLVLFLDSARSSGRFVGRGSWLQGRISAFFQWPC